MLPLAEIKPNTVDGIKKLAKQYRKTSEMPHHEALELAARQAGYSSFRHARGVLERGLNADQLK